MWSSLNSPGYDAFLLVSAWLASIFLRVDQSKAVPKMALYSSALAIPVKDAVKYQRLSHWAHCMIIRLYLHTISQSWCVLEQWSSWRSQMPCLECRSQRGQQSLQMPPVRLNREWCWGYLPRQTNSCEGLVNWVTSRWRRNHNYWYIFFHDRIIWRYVPEKLL